MSLVGVLAGIVATEGVLALLGELEGDPEMDVQLALQRLAQRNQQNAISIESGIQQGADEVQRKFALFNKIPGRALSQASFNRNNTLTAQSGQSPDTELLDFVSNSVGQSPDALRFASAPKRTGDLSGIIGSIGRSSGR